MPDLNWWWVCYIEAVLETDPNLKVGRIYEAIAAIEQRLLSPIEPGSDEAIALKAANAGVARLKFEACRGFMSQASESTNQMTDS
jgi:hypothetical protein